MRARHEAAVSTYDSNSAVEFGPDRTGEIRRGIDNEVSAQSDLRVGGEQEICERKKALGRVNVRRFGEGNKEQPISHSARRRKGSAGRAASLVSPSPRFAAPLPRRSPCEGGSSSGTIQFRRMSPMRNFRTNFAQRRDHYQDLTDKIIAALEAGTAPWRRPWNPDACGGSTTPVNATTGHRYRGVNVFVLGMSPFALASGDPRWCSYRQALARRWQVRRAERATPVYFYKPIEIADKSDASEAETRRIPMLRTFSVFHASQIDGIPAFTPPAAVRRSPSASRTSKSFLRQAAFRCGSGAIAPITIPQPITSRCRLTKLSRAQLSAQVSCCTNSGTRPATPRASIAICPAGSDPPRMRARS
jgi:hypothetical protein